MEWFCNDDCKQYAARADEQPTTPTHDEEQGERRLVKALREVQLRLCQARLASGIGNKSGNRRADFLLNEIGRIEKVVVEAALATNDD